MNSSNMATHGSARREARHRLLACAFGAFALLVAAAPAARANNPVLPGDDLWVTPGGATYDSNPIPAGFFNPGSDPFLGTVYFMGSPLTSTDLGLFPVDTIVRRPVAASVTCGTSDTIPIEIVALSLVSVNPIIVTSNGGLNPQAWDVRVCLDAGPQTQGSMTVNHECDAGGTYQASLPVRALVTFTRQSDLLQASTVRSVTMVSDGYWSHFDPGFGLLTATPGTVVDSNCSGIPGDAGDYTMLGTSNFFPGLWDPSCSTCGVPTAGGKKPLTSEQALLASHGVFVANEGKPQHVQAQACQVPTPTGSICLDTTLSHCSQRGGTPQGPGTICQPPPGPQYENWVIADDFEVTCAECQCDVDGNGGVCTLSDLAFAQNCVNNFVPGCERADFDCNGFVTSSDVSVVSCLLTGGLNCCPVPDPNIRRVKWCGSYIDPNYAPGGSQQIDSWLLGIHSDVPAMACPPIPAGTKPFDFCGVLDQCFTPPGTWLFTPNASFTTYDLYDPGSMLSGANVGDTVRICGYIDPNAPTCHQGLTSVQVQSVKTCDTAVSRPDRLVVQWAVDPAFVTIDTSLKVGCDGHQIYCYTVDLPNTCVDHDFSDPGELLPDRTFGPQPGKTYWLSVQAAVGVNFLTLPDGSCQAVANGNTLTGDAWGWHTTPPGYQHKDDAYMGQLAMGCPGEWIYHWMSHLHCSQPQYTNCCEDPTKSIDMAFELMATRNQCSNANQTCLTAADCPPGGVCVPARSIYWYQPVNPGPPTGTPPINPIPDGTIDHIAQTSADVRVSLNGLPPGTPVLGMTGPATIARSDPQSGPGGQMIVETEMLALDLVGTSPLTGPIRLTLNPLQPSTGLAQRPPNQYAVDSFFDVFVEIQLPNMGMVLHSDGPVRVQTPIFEIPPGRVHYQFNGPPITLRNVSNGQPVGTIDQVDHFVPYNGGVNVHSDVDWYGTPVDPCCEPDPTQTGCTPIVCPDPTETCTPVAYDCTYAKQCQNLGTPCVTDADCPGDMCIVIASNCLVTDCDCRDSNECQAFFTPGVFPPVSCFNNCPVGLACTRIGVDTDGDGFDDDFTCRCDPSGDPDGVCCDLANLNCFVTTQSACLPPNVFHVGQVCTQPEACCIPGGATDFCVMIDPICCLDLGGTSQPGGVCTQPEACCLPSGICLMMDPVCCEAAPNNGTAYPGQTCTQTVACCFPNDSCQNLDPICCQDQGGTPQPVGSVCLGDFNGIPGDDACDGGCVPNPPTGVGGVCFSGATPTLTPCTQNSDCPVGQVCRLKSRFLSINPTLAVGPTALQVRVVSVPALPAAVNAPPYNYPLMIGDVWWVGPATNRINDQTPYTTAQLQCTGTPLVQNWVPVGNIHIYGDGVVPGALYEIRACCAAAGPCSPPLRLATAPHGDTTVAYNLTNFADISALVGEFSTPMAPTSLLKPHAWIFPSNMTAAMGAPFGFAQISAGVTAFSGGPPPAPTLGANQCP